MVLYGSSSAEIRFRGKIRSIQHISEQWNHHIKCACFTWHYWRAWYVFVYEENCNPLIPHHLLRLICCVLGRIQLQRILNYIRKLINYRGTLFLPISCSYATLHNSNSCTHYFRPPSILIDVYWCPSVLRKCMKFDTHRIPQNVSLIQHSTDGACKH